jgi:hypothetical protein
MDDRGQGKVTRGRHLEKKDTCTGQERMRRRSNWPNMRQKWQRRVAVKIQGAMQRYHNASGLELGIGPIR